MNNKQKKILARIFNDPVSGNIVWKDIEKMLLAVGADIEEAAGSRVVIELNGIIAVFHRPHARKETNKGAIRSMRKFLQRAGIQL